MAGMGIRKIRIVNLPPEIPDTALGAAVVKYGKVEGIQDEKWTRQYKYAVSNGIRVVELNLKKHVVPSHMVIAGHHTCISRRSNFLLLRLHRDRTSIQRMPLPM
jgi:hypothetical protein